MTDPKSQGYSYVKNDLGWLIKQVDPVGARDTFQYNVGGELKRTTNRRNQNVDFSYDVLHRLTSRTGSVTTTWTYTTNSLVWSAAVSGVSTVTTYPSKLGPPDSVLTVLAGSTYKQRYRYTSAGLDSVWFTGSQDATHLTGRKYAVSTSTGALTTIRLNGNATSLGYDNALDPTSFSFPGGASRSLTQATIEQPTKSTAEAGTRSVTTAGARDCTGLYSDTRTLRTGPACAAAQVTLGAVRAMAGDCRVLARAVWPLTRSEATP